jgi:hypothetical protein
MHTSSVASLLVAALVVLRHPCTRNKATARLLLKRAAENFSLTHAEREACRNLADDLDIEDTQLSPAPAHPPKPMTDWGTERQRQIAAFTLNHKPKGIAA